MCGEQAVVSRVSYKAVHLDTLYNTLHKTLYNTIFRFLFLSEV